MASTRVSTKLPALAAPIQLEPCVPTCGAGIHPLPASSTACAQEPVQAEKKGASFTGPMHPLVSPGTLIPSKNHLDWPVVQV